MMRAFIFYILIIFSLRAFSQPSFQWAKNTHSVSGGMILDPTGNMIIAGTFSGTVDFDPGPATYTLFGLNSEAFVSKLDPAGNFLWATKLNSSWAMMNYFKTDASGNIYSTGAIATGSFDSFIWKLDGSGNTIWTKQMGGSSYDNGIDIEIDNYGNVYTTGVFNSPDFDFDPGPGTYTLSGTDDGYLSKLDNNGNFIWAKKIDNSSNVPYSNVPWNLIVDGANGVYFCGQFSGVSDFDPGISSYTLSASGLNRDGFVGKLDTAGNFLWAGSFPSAGNDAAQRLLKSNTGIYVTGYIDNVTDLDPGPSTYTVNSVGNGVNYILKLNSLGGLQWVRQTYFDTRAIARGLNQDLYFCGSEWTPIDFDPSPLSYSLTPTSTSSYGYLNKLDSMGIFKWAVQLQDTGWASIGSVAINSVGDLYAYGQFAGKVDFDPGPSNFTINSTGSNFESFALKLAEGTVGIDELISQVQPIVYPNPTSDRLHIIAPQEEYELKIFDLSGKILTQCVGNSNRVLDFSSYQAGLYILIIRVGEKTFNHKIVKFD